MIKRFCIFLKAGIFLGIEKMEKWKEALLEDLGYKKALNESACLKLEKDGSYATEGLPEVSYQSNNESSNNTQTQNVEPVKQVDAAEIKKNLKNEYKNLIKSIRTFEHKYMNLALKIDSIIIESKKPKINESLDYALDEIQDEINEVYEYAKTVDTMLENYKKAKKRADDAKIKITHIVSSEIIKIDIETLRSVKKNIGLAKQKISRIIDENNLHQNSKAIRYLKSLNGGIIEQDNGTKVDDKGYANKVMETIENIKKILYQAGV